MDELSLSFGTPDGYSLDVSKDSVGGRTYMSDEVAPQVQVWNTSLVDRQTLLSAILLEEEFIQNEQSIKSFAAQNFSKNSPFVIWIRGYFTYHPYEIFIHSINTEKRYIEIRLDADNWTNLMQNSTAPMSVNMAWPTEPPKIKIPFYLIRRIYEIE